MLSSVLFELDGREEYGKRQQIHRRYIGRKDDESRRDVILTAEDVQKAVKAGESLGTALTERM